jgi:uncharacterized membrane protein YfcA
MNGAWSVFFAAAVSFFIAILSGLGIGSGGLFVIWLTAAYGVGATQARGMNLLFFVFSAAAALAFHYKKRNLDLRIVLRLAFFAILGTFVGAYLSNFLDPRLLRKLFGGFLVLSGIYSLFGKKTDSK